MHRFARAAGRYEALVRTFTDSGMRLGEVLPLRVADFDGETLQVRRTAHEGVVLESTKTDPGEEGAGPGRPGPGDPSLDARSADQPERTGLRAAIHDADRTYVARAELLRDVWKPAQEVSESDIRPHECRHSYVSHLRAASINDADLAQIAGHRVETMLSRYIHPLGSELDVVRQEIG